MKEKEVDIFGREFEYDNKLKGLITMKFDVDWKLTMEAELPELEEEKKTETVVTDISKKKDKDSKTKKLF